jgi:trehalose/maltose hydrolase-like predicted phosphorylase
VRARCRRAWPAASWQHELALVAGFGGLRDSDGDVSFHPRLPAEWEHLRFRLQVRAGN